jgi:MFS family permease
MLAHVVPEGSKNTYLGLLTFAGLMIAMGIQPLAGALSDGWRSRFGRRRPLMVIGTLVACAFLVALAWSNGFPGLLLGYVGLQFSSNTAQGPLQGLLRDRVPQHQLGVASSVKVFLDFACLVAASFVAGRLMGDGIEGAGAVISAVMGVLLLSGAVTVLFTNEEPSASSGSRYASPSGAADIAANSVARDYWWLIAERGTFLLGVYGLQAFGQYYLQDALGVPDPARQAGNLLASIGAGTIVLVLVGGWLADRFGARPLLFMASAAATVGMLLIPLSTDLGGLYAGGTIVGSGIGLFLTANWALANRIVPDSRAGRLLGLTNLATAGAAALARLEGPAVDALNAAQPDAWLGYKGIFIFGAACLALSTWFLTKVRKGGGAAPTAHGGRRMDWLG